MVSDSVASSSPTGTRAAAARHGNRRGGRRARRGAAGARHARPPAGRFGRLVGLTVLGALVPGAALVAAGRRRLGWFLVAVFVAVVAAVAGLAVTGGLTPVGLHVATRPDMLLATAVGAAALGAAWCVLIVVGHLLLRTGRLTGVQSVVSAVLVAVLMGVVAVPSATAAFFALVNRSLVLTVFDEPEDGDDDRGGLASPDPRSEDPWEDHPRVNVLLLGSDAGADRTGTRTDTMIVASIDTRSGETVLFSLPRNLEGPPFAAGTPGAEAFPDGFFPSGAGRCPENDCHLNAVWTWAEANPAVYGHARSPGLAATRDVISGTLGLPLDYYAIVNLQGFEDVVNAIGGLRMDVERRIPIGGGINQATGRKYPITGWIEPGPQLLDGYQALWYARSREGSDDYDRMRRQRCTLAAVAEQAEPVRLARAFPRLASSAERNVETDVRGSELDAFVELALRVQGASIRSLPFTNDVIDTGDPDYAAIRALVQEALEPPDPAPSPSPTAPAPTSEPAPTAPGEPAPTPTPDPQQAQDVSEVCG